MTNFILGAIAKLMFCTWTFVCILYGFKIGHDSKN